MKELATEYYLSISQVSDDTLEALGCAHSFYFSKTFLAAFETSNNHISFSYLLFSEGKKPLGLAVIQQMDVALDNAMDNLPLSDRIARSVQCYLNNRKSRILVCGNIFLSGSFGVFVKDGVSKRMVYDTLSRKLKSLKTPRSSNVYFLKDFNAQEDAQANVAEQHQFQSFTMEPNMRLSIAWPNFETYKESLKSKYRVKVNKADSTSASLIVKNFKAKDILEHKQRLQELYSKVTDGAAFNAGNLNVETYARLKEGYGKDVIFNTYWAADTLVGFATAFKVGNLLDAHFIGIDYEYNKEYAIYPRMLNDYVRMAIDLEVEEINMGRTASEIKSTLGATAEHLRCYVKHKRSIANVLFKPLIRQIKMTEFKQHSPFKSL